MAKEASHAPARHEASVRARADLARARRRYCASKNWSWSGRQTVIVDTVGFAKTRGRGRGSGVTAMSLESAPLGGRARRSRPPAATAWCLPQPLFVSYRVAAAHAGEHTTTPRRFGRTEEINKAASLVRRKSALLRTVCGVAGRALTGRGVVAMSCVYGGFGVVCRGNEGCERATLVAARGLRQTLFWFFLRRVQRCSVDSIKPVLKARACFQRLKLTGDEPLSKVAFNFNLRFCTSWLCLFSYKLFLSFERRRRPTICAPHLAG